MNCVTPIEFNLLSSFKLQKSRAGLRNNELVVFVDSNPATKNGHILKNMT